MMTGEEIDDETHRTIVELTVVMTTRVLDDDNDTIYRQVSNIV